MSSLKLTVLQKRFAICKSSSEIALPYDLLDIPFFSITRSDEETSLVIIEDKIPEGWIAETGWRIIKVNGPLDFSLIGILSSISKPLAEAGISIFAISTYLTDYILVRQDNLEKAKNALKTAGFVVEEEP